MSNSFFRSTSYIFLSNFLIISCSLISSIISARILGPDKVGVIASLSVYPAIFTTIGSLGIRQSTTFFVGKKKFNESKIKTSITQIWLITSVLCSVICFILIFKFNNSWNKISWVILTTLPIPFTLFNTYNSGIFLGKNQISSFARINWLPVVLSLIFLIIFLYGFSFDVEGLLLAGIIGPLFMFCLLLFRNSFIKYFNLKFEWGIFKSLISLGLVYALAMLLISLNYKIDVIILEKLSTTKELGLYSKGVGIVENLWRIPSILSVVVFAKSAISKDSYKFSLKVTQLLRIALILVFFGSIVVYMFAENIILIMFGDEFFGSIRCLQVLLPGVFLLTIFKVLNMDLAGRGKPYIAIKAMLPALILNIVLNFIWIPRFGSVGAAISSTISYSIAALLFTIFYMKETKLKLKQLFLFKTSDFKPIINLVLKR